LSKNFINLLFGNSEKEGAGENEAGILGASVCYVLQDLSTSPANLQQ